jgi:SPP1 gp7 family putative phage head morphogenesis protein
MKSEEYWAKRMEQLNEAQLAKGEAYVQNMNREYGKAMSSIQKDIDVFYQRFAKNNGVDMASARQMLKAGELKEFKWSVEDYIKAGRENAIDQRWMKELENASIRVRMSRLESLQLQMRQHIELLSAKRQAGAANTMGGIYKDNYYRSIFELQKGVGLGASFAKLDSRSIDSLLITPWAPDGSNFSSRIWTDRTKLVHELQTTLTQGLIRGDSSDKMITQLSERMGVSRSRAETLILTESAYFSGASRRAAYAELDVEKFKNVATLDKRTSEKCRTMDGSIFLVSEAQAGLNCSPFHGRCRTVDIPHYEENVQQRAARDEEGKTYDVPGDLTYPEWAKQHAPADALQPPKLAPAEQPNVPVTLTGPEGGIRRFSDTSEAEDWSSEVSPDWIANLTREERGSIKLYAGDSYTGINERLRTGKGEMWDSTIESISSALQKFKLQENITVHRAADDIFTSVVAELPGQVITEKAFMSTSLLSGLFANSAIQMEIVVPKGTAGAPIMLLSSYEDEYEFLLDKGTQYVILGAVEVDGVLKIKAEVQPND